LTTRPATRSRRVAPFPLKPSADIDTRVIYCGDNLDQLPHILTASVDLIYIDPPFNSNRNYEVFWGETKETRAFDDRHASTQAYIEFMRPRCVELSRVLKKTGSFYYHCDWHAAHYVKVMLDQIFGENNFQNEIIWKRQSGHSDSKQGSKHFGRLHDTIFLYTNGDEQTWHQIYQPYDETYVETFYSNIEPGTGRRFQYGDLTGPGGAAKGNPQYEFLGVTRYWRYTKANMEELHKAGRIDFRPNGRVPRLKRYLDEAKGMPLQSVWTDIRPLINFGNEALGYPTQKPLALLERIIQVSSNENDVVLDAFCGCGTAIAAAQNLKRQWIGIDVSPTACRVMAKRLRDAGLPEDEKLWKTGRGFVVRDLPWSVAQLRRIPPFEFENWAVIALGGIPNKTQVGDMGIDGRIYPVAAAPQKMGTTTGHLAFMDVWYPVQVKQKDKAGRPDIDAFEAMMTRTDRTKGFFVSFAYTSDAMTEIDAFFRKSGKSIVALTVDDILNEQIARKLA
jgi:DNA modification methylase